MSNTSVANPLDVSTLNEPAEFRRQQVLTIGTMYLGYAKSKVLRMIPPVDGNAIRNDPALRRPAAGCSQRTPDEKGP